MWKLIQGSFLKVPLTEKDEEEFVACDGNQYIDAMQQRILMVRYRSYDFRFRKNTDGRDGGVIEAYRLEHVPGKEPKVLGTAPQQTMEIMRTERIDRVIEYMNKNWKCDSAKYYAYSQDTFLSLVMRNLKYADRCKYEDGVLQLDAMVETSHEPYFVGSQKIRYTMVFERPDPEIVKNIALFGVNLLIDGYKNKERMTCEREAPYRHI